MTLLRQLQPNGNQALEGKSQHQSSINRQKINRLYFPSYLYPAFFHKARGD